jgi:hypothetical protein
MEDELRRQRSSAGLCVGGSLSLSATESRRPDMVAWAVQALLSRGTKRLARLCRRLDDSYHGQMFSSRSTLEHDLTVSKQHVHIISAIEDSHPLPSPDLACTVRSLAACSAVLQRDRTFLLKLGYPFILVVVRPRLDEREVRTYLYLRKNEIRQSHTIPSSCPGSTYIP